MATLRQRPAAHARSAFALLVGAASAVLPIGSADSAANACCDAEGCAWDSAGCTLPATDDENAALTLLQRRRALQQWSGVQGPPEGAEPAPDGQPVCFSGLQSVDEYLACLKSVPIPAARRDCALDIVFGQLRSLYTYSGLVENSLATDAELASGFDFKVYELVLKDELERMEAEMRTETSAGMLALKLATMFGKFQDAHTRMYLNPLVLVKFFPPFEFDVDLVEGSDAMRFVITKRQHWAPEGLVGKAILAINGKAPLDYFLEVLSMNPHDRSPGTQLNRYLRSQAVRTIPPKDGGVFNVTLETGETHSVSWKAIMSDQACLLGDDYRICSKDEQLSGNCTNVTAVMQACFLHNPTFDNTVSFFEKLGRYVQCTTGGTLARKAVAPTARASKKLPRDAIPLRPWDMPDPPPGETPETPETPETLEVLETLGTVGSNAKESYRDDVEAGIPDPDDNSTPWQEFGLMEMVANVSGSCYTFRVDLGNGSLASVLKITSFGKFSDILPCAEAAVQLAAVVSDGSLIIDVIGNGGGYVSSGYMLNHYLYTKMPGSTIKGHYDTCEWYDLPENPGLSWFVGLSKQGLPDLASQGDPGAFISKLADRMDIGVEAFAQDPDCFGRNRKAGLLNESASCLRILLAKFASPEVPAKGSDEWTVFASLYDQCVKIAEPLGGGQGMSIMGYSPSNMFPRVLSKPNWQYYEQVVTKIRGGKPRRFSSMTFLGGSCYGYAAAYPDMFGAINLTSGAWPHPPQEKLKHITYLSDGTCGSTCSVAGSTAYLDGLATFVTYGGVKGSPMDITSFNGGNVGTYQSAAGSSLSKAALDSIADADIFYPESQPPNWPFLPVPLNIYKARFAQRAEYPRALGPKALPREWYQIPASYHLDIWTRESLSGFETLSKTALTKLHSLYVKTAAKAPKPLKRV